MCYRRIRKAHRHHRKTTPAEQGRLNKVRRLKEKREEQDYVLESMREWLHLEQLRSILTSTKS
jgi:hypothetical protein